MANLRKLEKAIHRRGRLGTPLEGSGRFKPGVFYPERVATQFKPKNYYGFKSIEDWAENYKTKEIPLMKEVKRAYRRFARTHADMQNRARQEAEEAFDILTEIMRSPDTLDVTKLQAITILLDRAYGKASQTNINANVDSDAKPSQITSTELTRRIDEALKRIEGLTTRTNEPAESPERPTDIRKYN